MKQGSMQEQSKSIGERENQARKKDKTSRTKGNEESQGCNTKCSISKTEDKQSDTKGKHRKTVVNKALAN